MELLKRKYYQEMFAQKPVLFCFVQKKRSDSMAFKGLTRCSDFDVIAIVFYLLKRALRCFQCKCTLSEQILVASNFHRPWEKKLFKKRDSTQQVEKSFWIHNNTVINRK